MTSEDKKTPPHIIVIGNEKGGCGKTTTAMHLIIGLVKLGFDVGSIDLDSRQRTLSRYLENRRKFIARKDIKLGLPWHVVVNRSPFGILEEAEKDERERFEKALGMLSARSDIIVIDSPGSDSYLSRLAHSYANTVVTPINDSFFDMDVLATVDGETMKMIRPSIYSEMLWEQKLERAKRDGGALDWVVIRNRLSMLDAKNKRKVGDVLAELSRRLGFRIAAGFAERVIFRELFLQGLTVLDVMDEDTEVSVTISHVTARQEVRELIKGINVEIVNRRIRELEEQSQSGNAREEDVAPAARTAPAVEEVASDAAAVIASYRSPEAAPQPEHDPLLEAGYAEAAGAR